MSCYRGWNYSKIALFLAYWNYFVPISDKFVETFKDELHESNKTLTNKISKQKIAHSLVIIDQLFIYLSGISSLESLSEILPGLDNIFPGLPYIAVIPS